MMQVKTAWACAFISVFLLPSASAPTPFSLGNLWNKSKRKRKVCERKRKFSFLLIKLYTYLVYSPIQKNQYFQYLSSTQCSLDSGRLSVVTIPLAGETKPSADFLLIDHRCQILSPKRNTSFVPKMNQPVDEKTDRKKTLPTTSF